MAETVLKQYHAQIDSLSLVPSTGGVFEITVGDDLIFSKKQQGRFPEEEEIISKLEALG